jgi:hypothetical protein
MVGGVGMLTLLSSVAGSGDTGDLFAYSSPFAVMLCEITANGEDGANGWRGGGDWGACGPTAPYQLWEGRLFEGRPLLPHFYCQIGRIGGANGAVLSVVHSIRGRGGGRAAIFALYSTRKKLRCDQRRRRVPPPLPVHATAPTNHRHGWERRGPGGGEGIAICALHSTPKRLRYDQHRRRVPPPLPAHTTAPTNHRHGWERRGAGDGEGHTERTAELRVKPMIKRG